MTQLKKEQEESAKKEAALKEKLAQYEIVKKEYTVEPTKGEEDATEDITKSEKVKSEVGKESLFELSGPIMTSSLEFYIKNTIENFCRHDNNLISYLII